MLVVVAVVVVVVVAAVVVVAVVVVDAVADDVDADDFLMPCIGPLFLLTDYLRITIFRAR